MRTVLKSLFLMALLLHFFVHLGPPVNAIIEHQGFVVKGWDWLMWISFSDDELYPGRTAYIEVWLENTGDQDLHIYKILMQWDWMESKAYYHNVDVHLKPGEEKYLGQVVFSIPTNIEPGYHSYRVGVAQKHLTWLGWFDDGWIWMEGWKTKRILTPPKIEITSCTFSISKIKTGETAELVIQIRNNGEATAKSVSVSVTAPLGLTLLDQNPKIIQEIPGNKIVLVKFNFKASKSGAYTVSVSVNSRNAGSDASQATLKVEPTATENLSDSISLNWPLLALLGVGLIVGISLHKRRGF